MQATASVRDANGNVLTGRPVAWGSSNNSVAAVSATGGITGMTPGTSTITATSEGATGSATMSVVAPPPAPVASVSVALVSTSLIVGGSTQATATTKDADGNVLLGRGVTWTATGGASVTTNGLVTALAAGTATITATSEGKSASAQVTVTPNAGDLSISIDAGTALVYSAGVTIAGQNAFLLDTTVVVGTPLALANLPPGTYAITAKAVLSQGQAWYAPPISQQTQPVTIAAGQLSTVTFTYQLSSGLLTVNGTGLVTRDALCGLSFDTPQATGSRGYGIVIANGQTTRPVPGFGPSQLKCDAQIVNGVSYEPAPVQQPITIPASTTSPAIASVAYAPPVVPGSLSLKVTGLSTADALVDISGPNNARVRVRVPPGQPLDLTGLSPGTYTVTGVITLVVINNQNVFYGPPPSASSQTVTIAPGGVTAASFAYVVVTPGS